MAPSFGLCRLALVNARSFTRTTKTATALKSSLSGGNISFKTLMGPALTAITPHGGILGQRDVSSIIKVASNSQSTPPPSALQGGIPGGRDASSFPEKRADSINKVASDSQSTSSASALHGGTSGRHKSSPSPEKRAGPFIKVTSFSQSTRSASALHGGTSGRRNFSSHPKNSLGWFKNKPYQIPEDASDFSRRMADPDNLVQCYISKSSDPYLNLAIEDHILCTSPDFSTICFLYVNRPCLVMGRNQNPWVEIDLKRLNPKVKTLLGPIDLVRRRSGGGTVFHDFGNLNWSIICPREEFSRWKYSEMAVRVLRKQGADRVRLNGRNDIVMDMGPPEFDVGPDDVRHTPYGTDDVGHGTRPHKVSGSAYKLTMGRALHHATTLLESPNLRFLYTYFNSPAKDNIKSKGVASVSSPITNIDLDLKLVVDKFQQAFNDSHGGDGTEIIGDELLKDRSIKTIYDTLRVRPWPQQI
jgi:lipoate-protein ligase A